MTTPNEKTAAALATLKSHVGTWVPPANFPHTSDEIWKTEYATATLEQRKNIATCWFWRLSVDHYSSDSAEPTKTLNRQLVIHASWIRELQPYFNPELSFENRFTGTRHSLHAFINKSTDPDGTLCDHLYNLWFGSSARRDSLLYLIEFIGKVPQRTGTFDDALPLLLELGWSYARESGLQQEDTELHTALVTLSRMCGRRSVFRPNAGASIQATGWYTLAERLETGSSLPRNIQKSRQVAEAIASTPDIIALEEIGRILSYHVKEADAQHATQYTKGIETDATEAGNTDTGIYDILRMWFPQYEKQWAVAESLGSGYETVCSAILEQLAHPGGREASHPNQLPAEGLST